jgi:hypothetical protein
MQHKTKCEKLELNNLRWLYHWTTRPFHVGMHLYSNIKASGDGLRKNLSAQKKNLHKLAGAPLIYYNICVLSLFCNSIYLHILDYVSTVLSQPNSLICLCWHGLSKVLL